jgi:hypothetical protein
VSEPDHVRETDDKCDMRIFTDLSSASSGVDVGGKQGQGLVGGLPRTMGTDESDWVYADP